ncbi:MAG: LapA family protein [Bacteroidales bacterium]|nr:LapA family protein [Bacteroidales bacterium]
MGYFKENTTKKVINLILIILLVIFVMLNLETTKVRLIFVTVDMPLVILISFVFLIGYFVGKTFSPIKCNDNKKKAEKDNQKVIEEN